MNIRLVSLLALLVAISACQKSENSSSPSVDMNQLKGAWRWDGIRTEDGKEVRMAEMNKSDGQRETPHEYIIDETTIRLLEGDERGISTDIKVNYSITGQEIKTDQSGSVKLPNFQILELTASKLVAKTDGGSGSMILKRIELKESLAGQTFKPIPQTIALEMNSKLKRNKKVEHSALFYGEPVENGQSKHLSCLLWKSKKALDIGFTIWTSKDGRSETSSDRSGVTILVPNITFDFKKDSETKNMTYGLSDMPEQLKYLFRINSPQQGFAVSSGNETKCSIDIKRNKMSLAIEGQCQDFNVFEANTFGLNRDESASLKFSGNCEISKHEF
jgi:hypothetical protein